MRAEWRARARRAESPARTRRARCGRVRGCGGDCAVSTCTRPDATFLVRTMRRARLTVVERAALAVLDPCLDQQVLREPAAARGSGRRCVECASRVSASASARAYAPASSACRIAAALVAALRVARANGKRQPDGQQQARRAALAPPFLARRALVAAFRQAGCGRSSVRAPWPRSPASLSSISATETGFLGEARFLQALGVMKP